MKIAFNPSTVATLTTPPNNKDITFDLRGRNIFARGVKFYGTDTNTWRDIKINNVSIGSHTLDLRNGSNTTLTNTNGVVTINSTWRPVVDNLTSDSTTSSLSAKQGKVLKALIDGKSNSDHNHDGRYVRYYAVTTLDCNNLAAGLTAARISATNAAHTNPSAYLYISDVGTPFQIQIPDSSIPYIYKRYYGSGKWSGWFKLNAGYADSAGSVAWANVTGKPSSYTPSAHTHAWNSLTHSSTTENQAILTNGKANGWKLQTLNIARWDNAANNAHSHANKSVLDGITSALVNSWNTAYNFVSNITGTDTDKVINKWEEIVNFLAGITEDNKLNTLLNSKLSVYELANNTNVGTIKNNGIYYSTTDASSGTLTNSPFNNGFTLINMTSYNDGDDLRRSRLAFNAYGEIKVSDDRGQSNTAETWYNVLTSKNSGINGSTIKLNGTSITVYSSGTADGRYVKKSGDTMSGVLTIDTTNFGALIIKRNDDANGASIQFRGKSSVYGYIGLNNSTKDKQFLRWSSDISRIYTILDTSSTYISNGKGVINGTTITQVDNATNSTNSTNARKLVNWYSARPTSLNAQFGDGSLRIFYATSSTTVGKPAEDSHILHLAWDNTDGWDAQLAVHRSSGKVSTRAQNGGTWQPWKTLAFTTDIPTSLKNPYSFNVFGVVYDGSAAKTVTTSTFVSQLPESTSTVTDGTMFITSWASNSGFADTNAVNVPYKRKAIHLWEYIKAKTDSLYATKVHNPAAHTHTVFKNNLMIKGTNGISDSASIHLGIGDSDTGFKWISDGVCQIYANNVAVGQWTPGGMNWFKNPTVNGNKVWNAGNDGSGSGLDADTLDGYHANGSNDRPYGHIPTIESDGVMEVGRYIDFHNDNNGKHDFSTRLQSTGNYGNEVNLPSASGTLALINDVNNYYWANVKISASSSTTTSPTVHTLTATRVCAGHNPGIDNSISCSNWFRSSGNTGWYNTTYQGGWYMSDTFWIRAYNGVGIYTSGQIYSSSSIRMSNILLEHTDEINNSANGGIHLNYRNSGNVSLCYGGGNVGIGTTTPSYKLDVNGQMRASGFHHSSVNSDNYILLAGGGYKSFGGDDSTPIFLGYLHLYNGNDGTISGSFPCLGYSVPFTYTRGGSYCLINIPNTSFQTFYIKAAIAAVHYSGAGMGHWVGNHRGDGAWWLHCDAVGSNAVQVKGFHLANQNNDSWWGGNPLYSGDGAAKIITVCLFGHVKYK